MIDVRASALINIPNALTLLRLLLVPVLLYQAWLGQTGPALLIIALCFLSDALDGLIARLLHQGTPLGARLDSIADFIFYVSIPLAVYWAWPILFASEAWFFLALLISVVAPALAAALKFRTTTSYHTWLVKLAALLTGLSLLWMLWQGEPWPFRASVAVSVLSALEEIAITLLLRRPRSNVHTLWHVLRRR